MIKVILIFIKYYLAIISAGTAFYDNTVDRVNKYLKIMPVINSNQTLSFEMDMTDVITHETKRIYSSRIASVVDNPEQFPQWSLIQTFKSEDRECLHKIYNSSHQLNRRSCITWVLSEIGDEKTVKIFINTLTNEFNQKRFNELDEEVVYETVLSLGFLAENEDSAFDFLKKGLEYEFWRKVRQWTCPSDTYNDTERRLVSNCILGMANSGRKEVWKILRSLKNKDHKYLKEHCGAICSAAFILDMIHNNDMEGYKRIFFNGLTFEKYKEWIRTEKGKRWREWAHNIKTSRD